MEAWAAVLNERTEVPNPGAEAAAPNDGAEAEVPKGMAADVEPNIVVGAGPLLAVAAPKPPVELSCVPKRAAADACVVEAEGLELEGAAVADPKVVVD